MNALLWAAAIWAVVAGVVAPVVGQCIRWAREGHRSRCPVTWQPCQKACPQGICLLAE